MNPSKIFRIDNNVVNNIDVLQMYLECDKTDLLILNNPIETAKLHFCEYLHNNQLVYIANLVKFEPHSNCEIISKNRVNYYHIRTYSLSEILATRLRAIQIEQSMIFKEIKKELFI